MSDAIVWLCTADGSYGGCAADDLIVVRESDMTERELMDLHDSDEPWGRPVPDTIFAAYNRIKREKES